MEKQVVVPQAGDVVIFDKEVDNPCPDRQFAILTGYMGSNNFCLAFGQDYYFDGHRCLTTSNRVIPNIDITCLETNGNIAYAQYWNFIEGKKELIKVPAQLWIIKNGIKIVNVKGETV
jgi:hypothetical protein